MGAGLLDELPQFFDRQNSSGAAMNHAVAVGAERAEVSHGVNHALAAASQRVQMVNLNVGTGIDRAVKRIEVEAARHARRPMHPDRGSAIARIAFVSSTLPKNFTTFRVTAQTFNTVSCVFRFNVCLRLGFDVSGQTLKTKLKGAGAAFMASASGLRLLQCAKDF
jgi:hypothetical protein